MPNGEERHFLPPHGYGEFSGGGSFEKKDFDEPRPAWHEPEEVPPREELKKYPKTVLLKIAIELDPDTVSESFREGWTKDDILRVIERHIKAALGRQPIEGWPYIHEVEIIESTAVEEEEEEEGGAPFREVQSRLRGGEE